MGDQSFARLIKKRRDALGLSQARLGELVGRSASTIRNWERALASPSERSDVVALAAVLGLDEGEVLAQAGFGPAPAVERNPTVEEVYASLTAETEVPVPESYRSLPAERPWEVSAAPSVDVPDESEAALELDEDAAPGLDEDAAPGPDEDAAPGPDEYVEATVIDSPEPAVEPPPLPVPAEPGPVPAGVEPDEYDEPPEGSAGAADPPAPSVTGGRRLRRAAPPTLLEAAAPVEASYIEDDHERRQYRVRGLATAALVIAIVIVMLWSFNRATDALGGLWDELVGSLAI